MNEKAWPDLELVYYDIARQQLRQGDFPQKNV